MQLGEDLTDSEIIREIKATINVEIGGLQALHDGVDGSYASAVRMIHERKGKVVMLGIGKSGIIARKIAATLASTGTTAVFVHPLEGMHGDLGVIARGDVVVAVSKSGENFEINGMLSVVRRIGAGVISITGNREGSMAKLSDVVVFFGDLEEACPFNAAPTTSTTACLVAGDAIALALMKLGGFNIDDFALFHPGGRLGKRLIARVSDIMLRGEDNPVIGADSPAGDMIIRITEKQAGAVSVIDDDGRLLGLITDYDIRKVFQGGGDVFSMTARDVMNPRPVVINEDEKAYAALKIMQEAKKSFTVMPVVDKEGIAVGMIRLMDIVKAGLL